MRFLDIFKTQRDIAKEEIVEIPWHVLGTMDQLDEIIEISQTKPVAIFKHSTRCGISRGVLKLLEKNYNLNYIYTINRNCSIILLSLLIR